MRKLTPSDNQLATAADFILQAMTEESRQKITLDDLKMAAEAVVQCMQNAPDMWPDLPSNKAQAFAGMCQVSLKKQYPWLVSVMD